MGMKKGIVIAAIGAAAVGGIVAYSAGVFASDNFVKSCELGIKIRLKAPSTYKRVDVLDHTAATTIDELKKVDYHLTSLQKDEMAKNGNVPLVRKVIITYDANNSFNAPVRGMASCATYRIGKPTDQTIAYKGLGDDHLEAITIKVDGKSFQDLQLEALRAK